MTELLQAIVAKLDRGDAPDSKWPDQGGEYWSLCPFHDDQHHGSFSVSERGFKCFSCGKSGGLPDLAEHLGVAVLHESGGGYGPPCGLTVEEYAKTKRLPVDLLKGLGFTTIHTHGRTVVRIPYLGTGGEERSVRLRLAMAGEGRFRWRSGDKPMLYGLWRLQDFRTEGYVILVEGESDTHTLWHHNIPALGVPGASTWKAGWAEALDGLTVYVWQEPDQGGETLVRSVGKSLPQARLLAAPPGRKDPSECHILGDDLPALLEELRAQAPSYASLKQAEDVAKAAAARKKAAPLLESTNILAEFDSLLDKMGLVGERRAARLLFLALTSRLLAKPISVVVKGPSAAGKSYIVETVLRFFPASSYLDFTSMSEHALVYDTRPISNRFIVIYEAAGMANDTLTYMLRSLLSEGRLKYTTVEKTADGLQPREISRQGPTGLLLTTTWANLHPENETRMLSVTIRDDREQTSRVLAALAGQANGIRDAAPDFEPWHALQEWLQLAGGHDVVIPYAKELSTRTYPRAVRLRRDFGAVLNLISTHAVLHQFSRARDSQGRIVAALEDYRVAHDLVHDLVSEGVQATVRQTVRDTVASVESYREKNKRPAGLADITGLLGLGKSAVSRRVKVALGLGYLVNLEDKKGKPARLVLGEPLPNEEPILPDPDTLQWEGGVTHHPKTGATPQRS